MGYGPLAIFRLRWPTSLLDQQDIHIQGLDIEADPPSVTIWSTRLGRFLLRQLHALWIERDKEVYDCPSEDESVLRQRLRPQVEALCDMRQDLHPADQDMLPDDPSSIMRLHPLSIEEWLNTTTPAVKETLLMSEALHREGLQDMHTFLRPLEPD